MLQKSLKDKHCYEENSNENTEFIQVLGRQIYRQPQ